MTSGAMIAISIIFTWMYVFPIYFNSCDSKEQMMLAMLEHSPDLYLDKIQEQLSAVHALKLSLKTISRTLKRLGIISKKVCMFYNV
jgi:hypothetical protein